MAPGPQNRPLPLSSQAEVGGQESGHKLSLLKGTLSRELWRKGSQGQGSQRHLQSVMISGLPFQLGVCPVVSLAMEKSENLTEGSFPSKLTWTPVSSVGAHLTSPAGGSCVKVTPLSKSVHSS